MEYGAVGKQEPGFNNSLPYPSQELPPPYGAISQPNQPAFDGSHEDFSTFPVNELQKIPGYNEATFDFTATAPPADLSQNFTPPTERNQLLSIPNLTEEQAREAAMSFVSEHCCYGSKPVKEMFINDISYKSAFHYTLETFTEKRETARAFKPYKGTPISIGYAPLPWEVPVNPKTPFKNDQQVIEIPNTEEIRICHKCAGLGHRCCKRCMGAGSMCCSWCSGSGHRNRNHESSHHHSHCHHCHGNGRERCFVCHGSGHVTCDTCDGKTQLRFFIKLTITWTNHVADHISETTNFPKELIRDVSGQVALEERHPRVWPVNNFPDHTVNQSSQRLISNHANAFPLERVLEQRQRIRIVPIAEVEYKWKENHGRFHVYGFETKVYFPEYPQPCCWGCNLL